MSATKKSPAGLPFKLRWLIAVRDAEGVKLPAFALASALYTHMNPDGSSCRPGNEQLCREVRFKTPSYLRRVRSELVAAGFLEVGKPTDQDRYRPLLPAEKCVCADTGNGGPRRSKCVRTDTAGVSVRNPERASERTSKNKYKDLDRTSTRASARGEEILDNSSLARLDEESNPSEPQAAPSLLSSLTQELDFLLDQLEDAATWGDEAAFEEADQAFRERTVEVRDGLDEAARLPLRTRYERITTARRMRDEDEEAGWG